MGLRRTMAVFVVAAGAWCVAAGAQQTQQQQPATQTKPAQEANPFPEGDAAPVIPTNMDSTPAASDAVDYGKVALADQDKDPVLSPDDANDAPAESGGSSSSSAGIDQLLQPPPEPEKKGKRGRGSDDDAVAQPHKETAAEDEQVGAYYLSTKNWKGALSRFESAMVLDPENPDVFWGLGEAQRNLGQFGAAKASYQKLVEYDPDSKHGKEAKRLLKTPELANAPAVSAATSAPAQ